ncbi:uncharacterized protein LOC133180239 [Saccostrea echinata]|uniref:uncharacterized protein LOC133180239 n=1 Tax=Saccostrea echinata TaxID=191078 RepID=UPI002A823D8B|nr:uncharacterized protein LOC133180239 [Saccostrea echinata]
MDAAICRTCCQTLDKKSRRTIFSTTFEVFQQLYEELGYIPHENDGSSKYVCYRCYAKLKKLSKIDYDLLHKLDELRKEKIELIKSLRENLTLDNVELTSVGVNVSASFTTPAELGTSKDVFSEEDGSKRSRPLIHSPTPRKVKRCKPGLTKTPEKLRQPRIKLFTPSKIKVLFNAGKQIKCRIVKDAELRQVIKAISRGQPKRRIAKFAYNSSLKEELAKFVIHDIEKDITELTSKKSNCCLRSTECDNLSSFKFEKLLFEVQLYAPLLYKTLSHTLKDSVGVAVTTAIIARNRNMHMSALHHIIAQILDHSGATDECISLFQKLGLSVSSSAAAKKKVDLAEYQNEHINSTVINEKRELETSARVSAVLQAEFFRRSRNFEPVAKFCSQN